MELNDNVIERICNELKIKPEQAKVVLDMLADEKTVAFIARYRKEATGGLDEEQIRLISDEYNYGVNLEKKKEDVIRLIEEKGELVLCEFHDKKVYLEKRLVYLDKNDEYNARNSTNHFLKLKKGDIVSIVYQGKEISQIKKDGIVGYAYNTNLKLF